jgi:PAS domain S-box-containing protein
VDFQQAGDGRRAGGPVKSAAAPDSPFDPAAAGPDVADPLSPYEYGLRAAFEHAISGIALLDGRGRIVDCNAALSAMLVRPMIELADRYIGDLAVPEDRVHVEVALSDLRKGAAPTNRLSLRCTCGNGRTVWFDASIAAWPAGAASAGFVIELHDVSAWRTSENELRRMQTRLLQTEKMASIGQLAAGVAHEINNPLGYVYSNLHTLRDYVTGLLRLVGAYEEVERQVPTVDGAWDSLHVVKSGIDLENVRSDVVDLLAESQEGIQRVKKIVQDLKEFSHADSDDKWALVDLHKGLDSTLNIARNEFKYKATIEKQYGALPPVHCVLSQINQVFMNILINAGQAITENGKIRIATGVEGDEVWVDISDNGIGIPEESIGRIFDPFFTTKQVGIGTGLGLSLSYSIVEKHGGRIEVDSQPGGGARFRVWLPIQSAAPESQRPGSVIRC